MQFWPQTTSPHTTRLATPCDNINSLLISLHPSSLPSPFLAQEHCGLRLLLHYSSVNKKVHASTRFPFLLRKGTSSRSWIRLQVVVTHAAAGVGGQHRGRPAPRGALHVSQLSTRLLGALTGERIQLAGSWPLLLLSHGLSASAGAGVLSERVRVVAVGGGGDLGRARDPGLCLALKEPPSRPVLLSLRWDWAVSAAACLCRIWHVSFQIVRSGFLMH